MRNVAGEENYSASRCRQVSQQPPSTYHTVQQGAWRDVAVLVGVYVTWRPRSSGMMTQRSMRKTVAEQRVPALVRNSKRSGEFTQSPGHPLHRETARHVAHVRNLDDTNNEPSTDCVICYSEG